MASDDVAARLLARGNALFAAAQHTEAIAVFDDVIKRFQPVDEASARAAVAEAGVKKGLTLLGQTRIGDANRALFGAIDAYRDCEEPETALWIDKALLIVGQVLIAGGEPAQAENAYAEVAFRCHGSQVLGRMQNGAVALCEQAELLGQLDRAKEQMEVYRDVIARYSGCDDAELSDKIGTAMVGLAALYRDAGDYMKSIELVDQIVSHFSAQPLARPILAGVLLEKGILLEEKLARPDDAIEAYDQVQKLYLDSLAAPGGEDIKDIEEYRRTAIQRRDAIQTSRGGTPTAARPAQASAPPAKPSGGWLGRMFGRG